MDRRQFLQRAMFSRSSSSSGTSSSTTTTKKDSSYSTVAALPLSDSNASPLRRKSISFSPYNTYHGNDGPNSPSHPTILRPPNSPLNHSLVSTAAAASSPPLANRKPVNNSPRRLYRQRSSEESQSRGLWPASKKKNNIPAPDAGTETLGSFIDEDRRIEAEDRPTATYNTSTFSSRQRISFSDQSASTPETRGRRSLRYHIGKLRVENQLKKPGTPPSPSSSSSSSSGPQPSAPALPGRLSFNSAALTKKRSDSGLDIPSTESETPGRTPRLSRESSRRPESPARRSRSPAKGRTSGVSSLISQGLSNLFRRKSFHHAESPKPLKNAAAAGAGSPVREVIKPAKANSSPGRDNVAAAAGRSIAPIGSPARGAAAIEGGATQVEDDALQSHTVEIRQCRSAGG
ncbi:hypothetical protein HPP92_012353 [Vanilla planifolia]|uniref:Uncharacterized protein n=1 Tax=Vanilla planifolia TaxID=51239 RepID=A0A835V2N5_VANPL|nr:hypothetical protein HPP92_012353 [Vanilla planifolia]